VANPQLENGYTRLANSILEALFKAAPRLSGTKVAAILFVIRQTYGWQRKDIYISYRYLAQSVGISDRQAFQVLDELIHKHKIIDELRPANGPKPRKIRLNKDYETWEV
jgi:phage replication O-like protein O